MHLLAFILSVLRPWLRSRAVLMVENLALRQQLAVLRRSVKRPRVRDRDRLFWIWLSRIWTGWSSALVIGAVTAVPILPAAPLAATMSVKEVTHGSAEGFEGTWATGAPAAAKRPGERSSVSRRQAA